MLRRLYRLVQANRPELHDSEVVNQGTREAHLLLHASTQFPGIELSHVIKPNGLETGMHTITKLLPRQLRPFPQQKTGVLLHSEQFQQGRVLEHHPHVPLDREAPHLHDGFRLRQSSGRKHTSCRLSTSSMQFGELADQAIP